MRTSVLWVSRCGFLWGGLALFPVSAKAVEAQDFVGQRWSRALYASTNHPVLDGCSYEGGAMIERQRSVEGFGVTFLRCEGQRFMLLEQELGREGVDMTVRILDARRLPNLKAGEDFMDNSDCLSNGRDDRYFVAIVRFAQRNRVAGPGWVRAAWQVDRVAGRIRPLSTRRISCERPTPP